MNGQRGMTMVELVVAIATTGIIVAFLGTAIYQIITVSGYGNDRLTATHELQNAAHWFNNDGQRAKAATVITVSRLDNGRLIATQELQSDTQSSLNDAQKEITPTVSTELELTMTDNSSITFSLDGTDLKRTSGGGDITLAQNITEALFTIDNRLVTMSLTSTPSGRYGVSENGTYHVLLRPSEEG